MTFKETLNKIAPSKIRARLLDLLEQTGELNQVLLYTAGRFPKIADSMLYITIAKTVFAIFHVALEPLDAPATHHVTEPVTVVAAPSIAPPDEGDDGA